MAKHRPHIDDEIIKEGMRKCRHLKNPYTVISRSISHRQSAKYIYYRHKSLQGRNPINPIQMVGPLNNVNVSNTQLTTNAASQTQ